MIALAIALLAAPQMHDMGAMPGMTMPAPAKTPAARSRRAAPAKPARSRPRAAARPMPHAMPDRATPHEAAVGSCPPEHAAMDHCQPAGPPDNGHAASMPHAMPGMAMPGMVMPDATVPGGAMPGAPAAGSCPPEHAAMGHCRPPAPAPAASVRLGTDQPAGDAAPPASPADAAAARYYDPAALAAANRQMRREHGGMTFSQVLLNLAEVQVRRGRDAYRWDGEGWFGGDIHRLVIRSEGEGTAGDRIDRAEVQALYARAIGPYFNLQAGVRQDLGSGARRTYAVAGVEGLAPYWFDVEGTVFLSDKGDLLARAEAWVDQRITQRLILQPRVELNLAAQDVRASRIGAGLSDAEIGLRLRYEIAREFAPYIGLSWEGRYGATARYARRRGGDDGGVALTLGTRFWF